tara:strand:+ start:647 stop:877 length:231 start_codon:yes stop_codon:yes gene_type:complete
MKSRLSGINIFLSALSILCFWYIKFSFERGFIGLRGSRFEQDGSPFLFWSGIIFVAGVACYLLYLIFFGKQDVDEK